jgi:hypothetical protein
MTPQGAKDEIRRIGSALVDAGLAIDSNLPVLRRSGAETIVTWPADPVGGPLSDHLFGTIEEYRDLVLRRQYTCALIDGSLLQLSFTFNNARLIRNRLCFYPCPLALDQAQWNPEEIPLLDFLDDLLVEEFDYLIDSMAGNTAGTRTARLRMRGPIRFDFAPDQQANNHPASHVHIAGEDVRLPVFGPLSAGHFIRFIVRHFYPKMWVTTHPFQHWPQTAAARCVTPDDEESIFLDHRTRLPTRA